MLVGVSYFRIAKLFGQRVEQIQVSVHAADQVVAAGIDCCLAAFSQILSTFSNEESCLFSVGLPPFFGNRIIGIPGIAINDQNAVFDFPKTPGVQFVSPCLPSQVPCGLKVDLEVLLKVTNQVCLVCHLVSLHVLATSKLQRVAFRISPSGVEDDEGVGADFRLLRNCSYSKAMLSKSVLTPLPFVFSKKTIEL